MVVYLDIAGATAIAREVITTHKKLSPGAVETYVAEHVPTAFAHFDVNSDHIIEVERVPQFLRLILDDVEQGIGLQTQVARKKLR